MKDRLYWLVWYWLPPVVWMVLICPLTGDLWSLSGNSRFLIPLLRWLLPEAPEDQIRSLYLLIRKVGHFIAYFILAWLFLRALRARSVERWRPGWALAAVLLTIGYAVFDEVTQSFLPTRTASVLDVVIDSAGAITAMIAAMLYQRVPLAAWTAGWPVGKSCVGDKTQQVSR